MKREHVTSLNDTLSESSDDDHVTLESYATSQCVVGGGAGGGSGGGGGYGGMLQHRDARTYRKKRRGVIEKRRRDRINGSLSELKRLVPLAFEKQGSTKLEKAEILQMTVEHLRMLNSKGLNGYTTDANGLALDYRGTGYRECVAEVARYLSAAEGLDFNDPMRIRLLGHLEAHSAQREASAKANIHSFAWNSAAAWSATGLHASNTSLNHSKLSTYHGFSSKPTTATPALGQFGLIGSAAAAAATQGHHQQVDNHYLAASRLGSTIGLTNHMRPLTSSNLAVGDHVGVPVNFSTKLGNSSSMASGGGFGGAGHFGSTHVKQMMSDVKTGNMDYAY